MFIYVLMEKFYDSNRIKEDTAIKKANLESAVGEEMLIYTYKEITKDLVLKLNPKFLIFGGMEQDLETYEKDDFSEVNKIIKQLDIPMLCICGSCQLLSELYNKNFNEIDKLITYPIKKLNNKEDSDILEEKKKNYYVAFGFYEIEKLVDDSLFEGLDKKMVMKCSHYCEVKKVPEEFELIASSEHSKVEATKHKNRLLYSVQFHPERYDEEHLDGKKLIINFNKMAEEFWNNK